jgi:hypothetical protein
MAVKTLIVGDEAQLKAALYAATGDTEIRLLPGEYDALRLTGINPTGTVTIKSDDPEHRAIIDTMSVNHSSNLTFTELDFRHLWNSSEYQVAQVKFTNSHDITLVDLDVSSRVDANPKNDSSGINIETSSRVSILDNQFHDLRYSLFIEDSDHVVIAGNDVRHVREGFDIAGTSDLTIDRNMFTEFRPMLNGAKPDHPDAIQFWTSNSTGSSNVEITNNAFLFGDHQPVQGIFMRSERGDVARHSDITIANNVYLGQSRHGISVSDADGVEIVHNTVLSAPKSGRGVYLDPGINTGNTHDAVVEHNISALMTSTRDVDRVATDNVDSWDTRGFGGVSYADLFSAPINSSTPVAGFVAKAGSVADKLDAGFQGVDHVGNWSGASAHQMVYYHNLLDIAGNSYI